MYRYDGYSKDNRKFRAFAIDHLGRNGNRDRDKSSAQDNGEDKGEDNNDLKDVNIINLRYQSILDRLIFEYMKGIAAILETILEEGEGEEYSGFPYRLMG